MHTMAGDTIEAYIEGDDIALESDLVFFQLTQEEARQLGERLLQLSRALETGEDYDVLEEIAVESLPFPDSGDDLAHVLGSIYDVDDD